MKLLFFSTLLATICYVSGGKTARLLAAMNAMGLGVNPVGLGVNPVGLGLNPVGLGVNPAVGGLLGGGLVRPIVIPGGAGFIGQPQFPQFMPAVPAYGVPQAPIPNMYPAPAPAANQFPYMGVAQMGPFNPAQPLPQQVMGGVPMGNMQQPPQQPLPAQPDPLQRFRRQVMIPDNTAATTVDTQIPPPTEGSHPCNSEATNQNN